jgi:steroid 5-alpha reductase family enzyme
MFLHASGLIFGNPRTEKYYDLTGSITFVTLTLFSLSTHEGVLSWKQYVISACVFCWSMRLGWFLFSRICQEGGIDSRFEKVKKDLSLFWLFWTIQGFWCFLTSFPVLWLNSINISDSIYFTDKVGIALWVLGFLIEARADYEKRLWKSNKITHSQFIHTGLWSLSRHPNYFGEILLWHGLFISTYSSFHAMGHYLCMISPIFVTFLLVNISGIPLLEKAAEKRWGQDPMYKSYKHKVPTLIPFFGRAGDAPW